MTQDQDDEELPERAGEDSKKPLIEYPTVYPFKVMGLQEHGFKEYVRTLFRRLMGTEISPDSISEQPS